MRCFLYVQHKNNKNNNNQLTCSTVYLAATAYFNYVSIKTTSSLPHGGDVNIDDN